MCSTLEGCGWLAQSLKPRIKGGTNFTGGRVGSKVGLDVCEKSRVYRDSISPPSSPQPVTIPSKLPRSKLINLNICVFVSNEFSVYNYVCLCDAETQKLKDV
jgi:hypothetical protein